MKRILQAAFLSLALAAWVQAFWHHQHLPARVASHFNPAGNANGWMARDTYLAWQIGTIAAVAALLQGIVLLQSKLPSQFVNLPHRDYWLAAERRGATDAWVRGLVLAIGCLLMAFFMAVFHLVYLANQAATPHLPDTLRPLTVLMLLATLGIILLTVLHFARKPAA